MGKTLGISICKSEDLHNVQKLWDRGVRFVVTEGCDNDMLRKVLGQCQYQGLKFGIQHTLRYPPMSGTAKSQVAEFYNAVRGIPVDMPYILNLTPWAGFPIPPDKTYQEMANTWLQDLLSYFKGADRMVRVDGKLVVNMTGATGNLVDDTCPLWIHQPEAGIVVTRPYRPAYVLRSYGARDWDGNLVQPIEFNGDMVLFNLWLDEGKQTTLPGYFPPQVQPPIPVTPGVTAPEIVKAKLDQIDALVEEIRKLI
jgi:hypothetical protein